MEQQPMSSAPTGGVTLYPIDDRTNFHIDPDPSTNAWPAVCMKRLFE
jgi:hypothetical protein